MEQCGRCGAQRTRIVNTATLDVADMTRCPHCDQPCTRPRCPTCARLLKKVRIIPRDDGATDG